jgi:D-amino-acid dehydrogenase
MLMDSKFAKYSPLQQQTINDKQQTTIIGGGVIGLSTAYYLQQEGYEVTVIERGDIHDGCSFGNMGFMSPSHFVPLASPGIIAEGIRHMFNSSSPFYIKPRLDLELMQWMWHFWKSCNASNVKENAPHLNNLLQLSRNLINDIRANIGGDFNMEEKGCLMLCREQKTLDHEFHLTDDAEKLGLKVDRLNRDQVQQLEPDVELNVAGAVLFKDDCHFDPGKFMLVLKSYLENKGVRFQLNTEVTGFNRTNNSISSVITDKGEFSCGHLVIAPGSWLPAVAKMIGIKLLLQGGKGYSYTYDHVEKNIRYPSIMVEGRCAITPWQHRLRIGGTMELSGINNKVLPKRMLGVYNSVQSYYPGLKITPPPADKIWNGLRPVTPDGLPYIGRVKDLDNVLIAGGHAMLGVSLAPGTGKIVTDIILGKQTTINAVAFNPERFK